MEDYKVRVAVERTELNEKIVKLTSFLFSDKASLIDEDQRNLMLHQLDVMKEYSRFLTLRMQLFNK